MQKFCVNITKSMFYNREFRELSMQTLPVVKSMLFDKYG